MTKVVEVESVCDKVATKQDAHIELKDTSEALDRGTELFLRRRYEKVS